MKNQYFGDINDYRKYGLLRILTNGGEVDTAVCWMLKARPQSRYICVDRAAERTTTALAAWEVQEIQRPPAAQISV